MLKLSTTEGRWTKQGSLEVCVPFGVKDGTNWHARPLPDLLSPCQPAPVEHTHTSFESFPTKISPPAHRHNCLHLHTLNQHIPWWKSGIHSDFCLITAVAGLGWACLAGLVNFCVNYRTRQDLILADQHKHSWIGWVRNKCLIMSHDGACILKRSGWCTHSWKG